jgi:hypothetical protein
MRITEALLRTIISESLREHMKPVGAVTTARGKATVFYDPEVTLEENGRGMGRELHARRPLVGVFSLTPSLSAGALPLWLNFSERAPCSGRGR